jgi:hypothetical protein
MRSTTDLAPEVRARVDELAKERGQTVSATIADLTVSGLRQLDEPVMIHTDPVTGLPNIYVGRPLTQHDIDEALDE